MFALLSLLFFQGMGSEVYLEREEASDRARSWGLVFALLAPDNHPNPEVYNRICRAKIGYPHNITSLEYWLRIKDPTLHTWHEWVVRNHGSQIYSNLDIQYEIADRNRAYYAVSNDKRVGEAPGHQFAKQFKMQNSICLLYPISERDIVVFDEFITKGGK